jgi:hypothetical protein
MSSGHRRVSTADAENRTSHKGYYGLAMRAHNHAAAAAAQTCWTVFKSKHQ